MKKWMPVHDPYSQNGDSPINHDMIEVMNPKWDKPLVTRWSDLHPATNVAFMIWRPFEAYELEPEQQRIADK